MHEQPLFSEEEGFIDGASKDSQNITGEWHPLQQLIDGVEVREVKNVIRKNGGVLTEIFRGDWQLDDGVVDQIFQNILDTRGISGWHVHQKTTDRIFVNWGSIKIVLYDARSRSPTLGTINEFCFGGSRPALVVIPPGIWHAVQNLHHGPSALLNIVDHAYQYDDPDHWRLPIDTDKIPYAFNLNGHAPVDSNA